MKVLSRFGSVVTGVESWPRPKEQYQWREGRSAMELARRWFPGGILTVPSELRALLDSHASTKDCVIRECRPEFKTELPERGEGRNHDILIRATQGYEPIIIGIEAKTDESFGECIGAYCEQARQRHVRSGVPARARKLLRYLFARDCDPYREPFSGLRYQLLISAAATAAQAIADRAERAVFVVHELDTWRVDPEKASRNRNDFVQFISMVIGRPFSEVVDGQLYGPVQVAGVEYRRAPVDLLIGKIVSPRIEDWTKSHISPC